MSERDAIDDAYEAWNARASRALRFRGEEFRAGAEWALREVLKAVRSSHPRQGPLAYQDALDGHLDDLAHAIQSLGTASGGAKT